jgi:primosomal protein N' (replication factor Y) (superfamily II helicase)
MNEPQFASVILEVSIQKALDYSVPAELQGKIIRGTLVEVPLRGKLRRGYVVEIKNTAAVKNAFPISRLIAPEPVLTDELFQLALWMAKYYICPLGRVLKTILPAGVRHNTQQKMQYFIMRGVSREEMRTICEELRTKAPQQAKVLDVMLQVRKGILHTELLDLSEAPPSSVKSLVEKGVLLLDIVRTSNSFLSNQEYFMVKSKPLRDEQKSALQAITSSLDTNAFSPHLLFGVTGSGKTEVYLQAIEHALKANKGVIMLVPEIALTEQTIERIRCRIREPIAVLHHRLSDGERGDAWEKIKKGDLRIAIGARSAIFCPMPRLGLIIVDEEHEQSYKQSDDSPCYQARDVAVFRAKLNNATLVLGSATPSLESYHNAITGKYTLSKLSDRGSTATLPTVTIVDMKKEYEKAKGITYLSDPLLTKIRERKERGEQTILFLNRRGFHTVLTCQSCGKAVMCGSCDTKVTFHRSTNLVMCHLCGNEGAPPHTCPSCKAHAMIKYQGAGTEKVEAMLHAIFPEIKTLRIDADSTRHKGTLEILLQEFRSGKADVLIGTQMIAKGLHFPEVTLVGVLNCDSTLNIPDFRAQEQVFQLITQVAGRSGRSFTPGEVVLQTSLPEHSTIQHATKQDFEAFFHEEVTTRSLFNFPPFSRIVKFLFAGKDEQAVIASANAYQQTIQQSLPQAFLCHPVIPAAHARVKELYRYQFLVRGPNISPIRLAIEAAEKSAPPPNAVSRFIDVDPSSTFF